MTPSTPPEACSVCYSVHSESVVIVEFTATLRLCGKCLSDSVVEVYESGRSLPDLEAGLSELFQVTAETEAEVLAATADELAARCQRALLEARDPTPYGAEARSAHISVTVSGYVRDRAEALAREANLTLAQWVRRAIWRAFEETSIQALRRDA